MMKTNPPPQAAYAKAGVDVALGNQVKSGIQDLVKATHGPQVLGSVGGFGGFFKADFGSRMREPVLVSSIDGVGTKLKLAFMTGQHSTVGADLVNHCVNDIAVTGARPLFFLDYLGSGTLDPQVFAEILRGFSRACVAAGCALIGGETAQMPGIYNEDEYDLAGCIVGIVDRAKIIDGSRIRSGDRILGLASSGLHTNGYSLARHILFEQMKLTPNARLKGLRKSIGGELMRVHINYQPQLASLGFRTLKGAAHITGGGLIDNLPRILPPTVDALIEKSAWKVPRIFRILEENGNVLSAEMYQVFNMGVGMALIVSRQAADKVCSAIGAFPIGRITNGEGRVHLL